MDERLYYDKMLDMFGMNNTRMSFVKQESIQSQFYSDLVTPIENGISVSGTTVHIFYAVKMGEKYLKRYHRHFENPDIRRHDMQHEELLICFPKQWAEEVRKCCGLQKKTYERHDMFCQLLMGIGVDKKTAAPDICEMEHAVSPASYEALKSLVTEGGT